MRQDDCHGMENTRNEAYFKYHFGICKKELRKIRINLYEGIHYCSQNSNQVHQTHTHTLWSMSYEILKTEHVCIIPVSIWTLSAVKD